MRALNVPSAGEAPVVSDVPTPEVSAGTVLVKVTAAGLNAIDVAIASGMLSAMMPHEYPVVLGRDAAGTVVAVGEGVDHVAAGDEVLGHVLLQPPVQAGTFAEYALLSAETVTPRPPGLDPVDAAALPLVATTAALAIDAVDPKPGQLVLVVGASGGVGSFVLQLLGDRDVTVIATGLAEDSDRLFGLGADEVIDYTVGDLTGQLRESHPEGADALIDLVARTPEDLPLAALRPGAKVSSPVGAADPEALSAKGFTGTNIMGIAVREVVAPLASRAASGELSVDVQKVVPLERAAEALDDFTTGHTRGKTVIKVAE